MGKPRNNWMRRAEQLEAELAQLKAKSATHDGTTMYLIQTAETLTAAARCLIEMRDRDGNEDTEQYNPQPKGPDHGE